MAKEPKTLTFDEFADELLNETQPRAIIILASSQIDVQLRNILDQFLLPKFGKPKDNDELLDIEKPLATFSSRIRMCMRLGVIDTELGKILHKLREVRNNAAHWIVFGISESPLKENIKFLRESIVERKSYGLTVNKYYGADSPTGINELKAMLLTLCVLVASIESVIPGDSLRNNIVRILD